MSDLTLYTFEHPDGTPASTWYTSSIGEAAAHAENTQCRVVQLEIEWDGEVLDPHNADFTGAAP